MKILSFGTFCGLVLLLILGACNSSKEDQEADVLLAQVFNKSLYLSELEGMMPAGDSREDSTLRVNAYIERWVRESLIMHEAEKNIPKDLNIDELVRDYRASLVRHNYEKLIVELQLDSTVTQEEFQTYYDANKSQYLLQEPIVRCHLIKIPRDREGIDQLNDWWKSRKEDDFKAMVDYCRTAASTYLLDDSTWYKISDIIPQLPKGVISVNNFQANRDFSYTKDEHRYLLRINELGPKNEVAPMSYIAEQANKVILHQRKAKLLKDKKEEIYERELRRNNIQIFNH